jgi:hypothetical protein
MFTKLYNNKNKQLNTKIIMKKIFTLLTVLVFASVFSQIPSYVPNNGLVGYWPFSGNANDESGNGYNGVVNGPTLTVDRFGSPNSAYSFDGINDFIQAPNYASNSSFTVSCWVNMPTYNLNSLGSNDFIFFGNHSGINNLNRNFLIGYRNFGSEYGFSTYIFNDNGINTFQSYPINQTPPSVNSWHHFVSVFENGTYVKMYLDNVLFWTQASNISQQTTRPTEPLFFGIGVATQYDFLNGKLDDVGFWNRALTEQEITNLYNSSLPQTTCLPEYVPTNGLVGYWPFCDNANDESGNGNNGTVNGATLTTDRFGNTNSAYNFDGINDNIGLGNFFNYTSFSISMFVKPGNQNGHAVIIDNNHASSDNWVFQTISNFSNNGYNFINSNEVLLSTNNWNHVILSYSLGVVRVYLNGNLVTETAWSLNYNNSPSLFLGYWQAANARFWKGDMDDIGIWNRALTQTEITGLYNSTLSTTELTQNNDISIYPNPANDHITIDCGNLANVVGYQIKIVNTLGQEVFSSAMNTQQYVVPLNTWTGTGVYFVKIYDASNNLLNTKKIILQ